MLNALIGNTELKQGLLAALHGGRLSHSVLLCGEEGVGTNFAARCLAADYLYPNSGAAADAVLRGEGAECLVISGEGVNGEIKIDAVREVRREVYNTSISAHGRVVLIRGAHKLNAPSANAVLKVLEEPPDNVLFILTAQSEAAVLPTIRSRCAVYTVCAPCDEECAGFLVGLGASPKDASRFSKAFAGRIGLAKRVLESSAEQELFNAAEQLCIHFEEKNESAMGALLSKFEKDKPAAQTFFMYSRLLLAGYLHRPEYSQRASAALCAVYEASGQLARNASAKLVFTVLAAQACI